MTPAALSVHLGSDLWSGWGLGLLAGGAIALVLELGRRHAAVLLRIRSPWAAAAFLVGFLVSAPSGGPAPEGAPSVEAPLHRVSVIQAPEPPPRGRRIAWSVAAGVGACAVGLFWGRWLEGPTRGARRDEDDGADDR